jgi:hypothetical protein
VKHYYLSQRAQLHFELSNVVNEQKFEKLLTLNEAQKTRGPNMAVAVKLLRQDSIGSWLECVVEGSQKREG